MKPNSKCGKEGDRPLDSHEQLIVSFVIIGIVIISSGLMFLVFR